MELQQHSGNFCRRMELQRHFCTRVRYGATTPFWHLCGRMQLQRHFCTRVDVWSYNGTGILCEPCPALRTNADIVSRTQRAVTYRCSRTVEVLEGSKTLFCTNGTWSGPPPTCKDIGGLSERDITIIFGIVGGAAGLAAIGIFIGLLFMACYRKDRANRYKSDIMAMNIRNGGAGLDEDIYYPPGYANPGFGYDRNIQPELGLQPVPDMRHAIIYDPETMSKREISWQYRLDGSQMSIPRPVIGRAAIYSRGESSTDWEYGSHPDADQSRETTQFTM
ncbi:uncharacterized protein LOC135462511 [Liolophura sinensis]|uniref:uncharacterized protein LOC135462511 n=1 Tax=Liolophura sinensis TaxID=3198878 RepID=UPI0031598813